MKKGLLVVVFLLFFILLRWNSFTTPFERDEGEYAYSAWIMRQGTMPYENSFLQKPPMIVYSYVFSQILFGDNLWGPRVLAALFILVATFLLFKLTTKQFGERLGWITVFIFTPIVISPINSALSSNTEIFMLLPLIWLLYLFVSNKRNKSGKIWVFSGMFASLALFYKPICLYIIVFIFLYWLKQIYVRYHSFLLVLKLALFTFLGFLISSFLIFLPFGGVLNYIWEEVFVFNSYYASHWGIGLANFFRNALVMGKSFWVIYILLGIYLLLRPKNWLFYFLLLVASLLGVFQTNIRHYYILATPFLAIISSQVIGKLGRSFLITFFLILTVLYPTKEQYQITPRDLSLWIYGRDNPFYESEVIADKMSGITDKNDKVFIAGSEPQILYYARRKSASRFVITYPLIIDTPKRLDYQKEAIEELQKNKPAAIVYSNRVHSGLWNGGSPRVFVDYLENMIRKDYKLVGGYVWDQRGGYWLDELEGDDLKNSSLLLYKKI